jgi:drug/metabolite transporter (DMT)-like permease
LSAPASALPADSADDAEGASTPQAQSGSTLLLRLAPVIFLLFWSGGFAAGKIGISYTGPMTFLAVRYALVLLILLPLLLVMRPPLPRTSAEWIHLAVVGFLIQGIYFALGYIALSTNISSAAVALITCLQPILVGLIAPRIAGERVGGWGWIGLGLGLTGAALVILARSSVEVISIIGVLAAIGALGGMTAGTLYEKRFGVSQHPVTANTVQYAAGLATTLPLALLLEDRSIAWTLPFGLSLLYLIVCNSLIAMTLLLMMIRRGEVSRVSALFFLVPPMAAVIGWVLLDEQMPPLAWAGLAIAAAGVALATGAIRLPNLRSRPIDRA